MSKIEGEIEDIEGEEVQEAPKETPEVDLATITEARKYGWRPKEEFDRDPQGWVDASRFLELPSTDVKRLRDQIKENERSVGERMARLDAANKDAMDRALKSQAETHERAVADIKTRQRAAVEIGDVAQWERLERDRSSLKAPEPVRAPEPDISAVTDYRKANEWANDPMLWGIAVNAVEANPDIQRRPAAEQLAYAESRVRDYFPHKFAAPARQATQQRVDGGGLGGGAARGNGVHNLPPEAVKAGNDFVRDGHFKDLADYAKEYWRND